MKKRKEDRRIKRSRQLLKDSFITLLEERNFTDITITNIVHRSDLNRSTFYAHFRDKEELLACIIDELLDGMISSMDQRPLHEQSTLEKYGLAQHSIFQLFVYVSDYASYFKAMLRDQRLPQFTFRLSESLYLFYFKKIKQDKDAPEHLHINHGFFANYIASVIVGFIYHWLIHTDMKYNPEYIAKEFNKIFTLNTDFSYLHTN
ncbi:MAG: TetR/AcrR family transcriptional regulator [Bacillus sp. (in: firmicutes)]